MIAALRDPDPRTDGRGSRGCALRGSTSSNGAARPRRARGDGRLPHAPAARPAACHAEARDLARRAASRWRDGESRWITGPRRARMRISNAPRHEAILVGRGTLRSRCAAARRAAAGAGGSRRRGASCCSTARRGARRLDRRSPRPTTIAALDGVDHLLVEGGAGAAAAFLARRSGRPAAALSRADPDRRRAAGARRYRARPIWPTRTAAGGCTDARTLGSDRLEVYERASEG